MTTMNLFQDVGLLQRSLPPFCQVKGFPNKQQLHSNVLFGRQVYLFPAQLGRAAMARLTAFPRLGRVEGCAFTEKLAPRNSL